MNVYGNLLAELESNYEEILGRAPNAEGLPKEFLVVDRERGERLHREAQRERRLEGLPPGPDFKYPEPVSYERYNAALLYKFIDEYEQGVVSKTSLELLHHIMVDVLEGKPFDLAFPLPGRAPSPGQRKEWGLPTIAQEENAEVGAWVSCMAENFPSRFPSLDDAAAEAATMFSVEPSTARKAAVKWRREQRNKRSSSPKK